MLSRSTLGDSRTYPYHTTGGISEFRGRGGLSWTGIPKAWGVTQFGIPKALGGGGGFPALNSVNFLREDSESCHTFQNKDMPFKDKNIISI